MSVGLGGLCWLICCPVLLVLSVHSLPTRNGRKGYTARGELADDAAPMPTPVAGPANRAPGMEDNAPDPGASELALEIPDCEFQFIVHTALLRGGERKVTAVMLTTVCNPSWHSGTARVLPIQGK